MVGDGGDEGFFEGGGEVGLGFDEGVEVGWVEG